VDYALVGVQLLIHCDDKLRCRILLSPDIGLLYSQFSERNMRVLGSIKIIYRIYREVSENKLD
jgi:hypothetical protein